MFVSLAIAFILISIFNSTFLCLSAQIDKPLNIPERPKDKGAPKPKEFFRNVMGSTAGAGSGEFHVFRATRRHEYARSAYYDAQQKKDEKDTAFAEKRMREEDELQKAAEKRRAKRQKKKAKKNSNNAEDTEPEIKKMMARPADLDADDEPKASETSADKKTLSNTEAKEATTADRSESAV
ncbi:hypothetical protein SARC_13448 [Sphaeroforma arctica JP610]|uniref:DUF1168 domain-containing protein n=1 Tax=Sphaeroforma arctica JP610 TaxID=667725 RepID=A0A0L0FB94_9EUKA|nr:hypothetical protein SARC_13448 [Sphaeroforma arctica JP610]KNC73992.1 hypothetical protein SARC_13448 [Sphaeroforma arctica JP610]|eukprot:XP_014147894.1 hypothetical protein SARC_13448 [Sphaeroforma arctica JP610]